jgi:hypothetical protein
VTILSEQSSNVKFEIGHVLFSDIVGYSKLLINEQNWQIQQALSAFAKRIAHPTVRHRFSLTPRLSPGVPAPEKPT